MNRSPGRQRNIALAQALPARTRRPFRRSEVDECIGVHGAHEFRNDREMLFPQDPEKKKQKRTD
jgi:hypothetical protein